KCLVYFSCTALYQLLDFLPRRNSDGCPKCALCDTWILNLSQNFQIGKSIFINSMSFNTYCFSGARCSCCFDAIDITTTGVEHDLLAPWRVRIVLCKGKKRDICARLGKRVGALFVLAIKFGKTREKPGSVCASHQT